MSRPDARTRVTGGCYHHLLCPAILTRPVEQHNDVLILQLLHRSALGADVTSA